MRTRSIALLATVSMSIFFGSVAMTEDRFSLKTPNGISFMLKDTRRFPDTDGWGYATFKYDPKAESFRAFGDSPDSPTRVMVAIRS